MTDLTADSISKADLFVLFDALEMVLEGAHSGRHEERTACLALATQINEEIGRRA